MTASALFSCLFLACIAVAGIICYIESGYRATTRKPSRNRYTGAWMD